MAAVPAVSPQRRRALMLAWWRYRRPALAAGAVLAVLVGYRIAAPGGPDLVPVTVAARDLAAGAVLSAADLRTVSWPESSAPQAAAGAGGSAGVVGATLASPLLTGEAITSTRLVGRSLLTGQPLGTVAVAVRLADPSGVALVRSGDRVDVLAATSAGSVTSAGSGGSGGSAYGSSAAQRVASSSLVLATPGSAGAQGSAGSAGSGGGGFGLLDAGSGGSGGSGTGGWGTGGSSGAPVLVLAVDQVTAGRLAAAQGDRLLSVVLLAGNSPPAGSPTVQAMPDPAS